MFGTWIPEVLCDRFLRWLMEELSHGQVAEVFQPKGTRGHCISRQLLQMCRAEEFSNTMKRRSASRALPSGKLTGIGNCHLQLIHPLRMVIFHSFTRGQGFTWVWVNTYRYIFGGMNIHLPAILGFTRYQGFDPSPIGVMPGDLGDFRGHLDMRTGLGSSWCLILQNYTLQNDKHIYLYKSIYVIY